MPVITKPYINYVGQYSYATQSTGQVFDITEPTIGYGLAKPRLRDLNSNPNWKTDVAHGRDASRPYRNYGFEVNVPTRVRFTFTSKPTSVTTRGFVVSGSHFDPSNSALPNDEALRDIALSRIKRKLATHTKTMNAVVPLVELGELRTLIRYLVSQTMTFLRALYQIVRNPLNGWNYRKLGKAVFDFKISEAWLAYSFAIKPTLSDIDAALEALKNYLSENPRPVVLRGTAKKEWKSSSSLYTSFPRSWGFSLFNQIECDHSLIYTYSAGFNVNLLSSNTYSGGGYNLQAFLEQFDLTAGKLGASIWELIPFSWLFDYFSTMGAFLDDAFESPAGSTKYCTLSRKYRVKIIRDSTVVGNTGTDIVTSQSVVGGAYVYYEFERSTYSQLPHRSLRLKTIDEVGINGVNRLLNLLAVFVSGSKRPPRG